MHNVVGWQQIRTKIITASPCLYLILITNSILKKIDPYAFDKAVKMTLKERKKYDVKPDENECKNYDRKWGCLN